MRATLYFLVMNAGAAVINALTALTTAVARATNAVATWCSPETAETTTALVEQNDALSELSIMQRMVFIKELAIDHEDWAPEHTQELNQLAYMLHKNHGWDAEQIDNYVGQLVAAGPEGYEYDPTGDYEDD